MLARTHFVFGVLIGLLCLPLLEFKSISDYFAYFLLIQWSVLLPDLDHPKANIHTRIPGLKIIPVVFSHRGFLHSIYPPAIISAILWAYLGRFYALPVFIGYVSHLFGDAITTKGIKPFNPFLNIKIRGLLITGSLAEKILFYLIIFLIILKIYFIL